MEEKPHFTIVGIPVRIRVSFFLVAAFLGWGGGTIKEAALGVASWMIVVFVSVLLHELGHAFVGRAFGLAPAIQLYGFGGLTSWPGGKNISAGRSVLISLAGPLVSVFLWIAFGVASTLRPETQILADFHTANRFWAIFNLLPIMPMDGGNAFRSLLQTVGLRRTAEILPRVIGIVLAGLLTITAGLLVRQPIIAIFTFMFGLSNVQSLVRYFREKRDTELLESLRSHYPQWMASKDGKGMIAAALQARAEAKTDYLRAYATEVLAMGQCLDGDPRSGLATLESSMPAGMMPGLPIYLHVLFEAGEKERAMTLANEMLAAGDDELKQQAQTVLASRQALSSA